MNDFSIGDIVRDKMRPNCLGVIVATSRVNEASNWNSGFCGVIALNVLWHDGICVVFDDEIEVVSLGSN